MHLKTLNGNGARHLDIPYEKLKYNSEKPYMFIDLSPRVPNLRPRKGECAGVLGRRNENEPHDE